MDLIVRTAHVPDEDLKVTSSLLNLISPLYRGLVNVAMSARLRQRVASFSVLLRAWHGVHSSFT